MDWDWTVSDDAVGLLLLGFTALLVLLGSGLAWYGLGKLAKEAEKAKKAAEQLETAAADSVDPASVREAAAAAESTLKDVSAALAEMKGPLAPARVLLAFAALVFVVAVAAFGIVDLSVSTGADDTMPTETEQTETEQTETTPTTP